MVVPSQSISQDYSMSQVEITGILCSSGLTVKQLLHTLSLQARNNPALNDVVIQFENGETLKELRLDPESNSVKLCQ
jgi:hypothetical protein